MQGQALTGMREKGMMSLRGGEEEEQHVIQRGTHELMKHLVKHAAGGASRAHTCQPHSHVDDDGCEQRDGAANVPERRLHDGLQATGTHVIREDPRAQPSAMQCRVTARPLPSRSMPKR